MIKASQRIIIVTDSSKFGQRSFRRICTADAIHRVITDAAVKASIVEALEEQGIIVDVV